MQLNLKPVLPTCQNCPQRNPILIGSNTFKNGPYGSSLFSPREWIEIIKDKDPILQFYLINLSKGRFALGIAEMVLLRITERHMELSPWKRSSFTNRVILPVLPFRQ